MASSRNSRSTDALNETLQESLSSLPQGSSVVVAFSGGLDSSVLLALAAHCAAASARPLSALHVHHGLSTNADAWAEFCRASCASLGVPHEVVKVAVPLGSSEGLEASARRLRYQVFAEHKADYVLLAHHANDQAETVLFNLMRGAGVRGAAAMLPVSGGGRYLRPLLGWSRADLEAYAKAQGLRWIDDESNADTDFSRNFIRHEVVPVLEKRFPAAVENLTRSAEYFAEAQAMLDEMARHDLGEEAQDFPVSLAVLKGLTDARARNVLRYLLGLRGLQAPNGKRLDEILRQFVHAAPDRHPSLNLPSYRLFRARGRVELEVS